MKKRIAIGACILAVLLVAGSLWYTRPRSFWDTLPGDPSGSEVTACYAILVPTDPGDGPGSRVVDFAPGSQEYGQLMELLESSSYRRDLFDLFRLGRAPNTQAITLAPYTVAVYFRRGDDQWSMDFWGPRAVAGNSAGASHSYIPAGGAPFQQQVADFVTTFPPNAGG